MGTHDPGRLLPFRREPVMLLRDLINRTSGIYYEDEMLDTLGDKLVDRILDLGLSGFDEYYYYLRYDPAGQTEWPLMMDAVTVKETYFLREVDQLRACTDVLLPRVLAQDGQRSVNIWCAACSTGEEPYSLAMLLEEAGNGDNVTILASDISQRALKHARRGVYGERALRATADWLRDRYLRKSAEGWEVTPRLRRRVTFHSLNLLDDSAMRALFSVDIIFCRNAFIYFDADSIKRVVDRFHTALNDDGVLFVGAAESLIRITDRFDLVEIGGAFAYRKC